MTFLPGVISLRRLAAIFFVLACVLTPATSRAQGGFETDANGNLRPTTTPYGQDGNDYWGTQNRSAGSLGAALNGNGGTTGVCYLVKFTFEALAAVCALMFLKELLMGVAGHYNSRQLRKAFILLMASGALLAPYSILRFVGLGWIAAPGVWSCLS